MINFFFPSLSQLRSVAATLEKENESLRETVFKLRGVVSVQQTLIKALRDCNAEFDRLAIHEERVS